MQQFLLNLWEFMFNTCVKSGVYIHIDVQITKKKQKFTSKFVKKLNNKNNNLKQIFILNRN